MSLQPDRNNILAILSTLIRDALGRKDLLVTRNTTAVDVAGWDSFKTVEIVLAAQESFGIDIDPRDLDKLACVGDLVDLIADKL